MSWRPGLVLAAVGLTGLVLCRRELVRGLRSACAGFTVRGLAAAPELGREWPVRIDVLDMDPQHRWIDLLVHLPFGVQNHEHITLTQTKEGGTLVRLN